MRAPDEAEPTPGKKEVNLPPPPPEIRRALSTIDKNTRLNRAAFLSWLQL